jgi:GNAT superfamily N-acetyltransferase
MSGDKSLVARKPRFFSEIELQDFIAMVRAGGEVGDVVLERNVREAECLVFLRRGRCLVGVAALKNPLSSYRTTIKLKSGVAVKPSEFPFELGYVFVLPSARRQGCSVELTRAALSAAGGKGVFATSRTINDGMQATLRKFGFTRTGSSTPRPRIINFSFLCDTPPNLAQLACEG